MGNPMSLSRTVKNAIIKLDDGTPSPSIYIMENGLPTDCEKDFLDCRGWTLDGTNTLTVNYYPQEDQCIPVKRHLKTDEAGWFHAALSLKSPRQHSRRCLAVSDVP